MPEMFDDNEEIISPEDLCKRAFSRCSNWPEDYEGQLGLAQGLKSASDRFGIPQEQIIDACREESSFCPTDHDLIGVCERITTRRIEAEKQAREARQREEWQRKYGKPQPFDTHGKCTHCGRDWKEICATAGKRRRELFNRLREHFKPEKGIWPSFRDMAPVARQLGYPDIAQQWERE